MLVMPSLKFLAQKRIRPRLATRAQRLYDDWLVFTARTLRALAIIRRVDFPNLPKNTAYPTISPTYCPPSAAPQPLRDMHFIYIYCFRRPIGFPRGTPERITLIPACTLRMGRRWASTAQAARWGRATLYFWRATAPPSWTFGPTAASWISRTPRFSPGTSPLRITTRTPRKPSAAGDSSSTFVDNPRVGMLYFVVSTKIITSS